MNSDVYLQLSATHIALEDFINLIPYLHNGLYIEPNNSNLLYNLGVSYYETGLYNKSIKILEEYFIQNQNDLTSAYYLGMAYYYNEDYSKSYYYLNLINNNSDHEILFYLGLCSYQLDEYNKSIRLFKKSLIIKPNNKYAIYALGQTYIALGDRKNSKKQLKTLMNLDISLFELLKESFDVKFDS